MNSAAILIYVLFVVSSYNLVFCTRNDVLLSPIHRLKCTTEVCQINDPVNSLNFLIVGDIGGLPIYPYASYAQKKVSKAMSRVSAKQDVRFLVNLGDNFYFNGVKDVYDNRFQKSFENVYSDNSLNFPWYTIGGNHDHLGNISAQILYTQHSSKWTFPKLFYKVSYAFTDTNGNITTVDIVMIDTIVLCGNTFDLPGEGIFNWMFAKKLNPSGPSDNYVQLAEEQYQWIDQTLQNSTADYLFVLGHYPIHSASEHGSFKCLNDRLDLMLRKYNANAYFSGHDHNLQHIQLSRSSEDRNDKTKMNYIVCGAGSRTDRSVKHAKDFQSNELLFQYPKGWNPFSQIGFSAGGFILAKIQKNQSVFQFFNSNQDLKYELIILPRH